MKRTRLILKNNRYDTEVMLYPIVFKTTDGRTFYRLSSKQRDQCCLRLADGDLAFDAPAMVGTGILGEYPMQVIFEGHHPDSLPLTDEQRDELNRLDSKRDRKGWEHVDGFYFQLKESRS